MTEQVHDQQVELAYSSFDVLATIVGFVKYFLSEVTILLLNKSNFLVFKTTKFN